MSNITDEQILSLPITHLVDLQIKKQLTAVRILKVYLKRAKEINEATNCYTCFVPEAMQEAQKCDKYLRDNGRVKGNLHGIPCTIKDHYAMKNLPVTMGLKTMKIRMEKSGGAKYDAVAVMALRKAGAIPIAKTNMTQQGDTWGGGNPAYGDTLNPFNTLRTPGGSSSGEGASVGGGASVFGIGSDVGGSVRCPANFSGVSGFKPTAQRFSFSWEDGRTILNHPGDYGVLATGGPLAKRVTDLVEVLRACWAEDSPMTTIDTRMPPIPFNNDVLASSRPLTIGYHVFGGYTSPSPCPAVVRIMNRVVQGLKDQGHILVPFDPENHVPWENVHPVLLAELGVGESDPGESAKPKEKKTTRKGNYSSESTDTVIDETHPDLAAMSLTSRGPGKLYPKPKNIHDYHNIITQRDRQRDTLNRAWRNANIDVLICPAWAFPAPPVHEVRNLSPAVWTTQAWNYFDLPAGVVQSGSVTSGDLKKEWKLQDKSTISEKFQAACLRSRAGSEGMPIAVQVIGQPWREELVLRGMLEVERVNDMLKSNGKADDYYLGNAHPSLQPIARRSKNMGDIPSKI